MKKRFFRFLAVIVTFLTIMLQLPTMPVKANDESNKSITVALDVELLDSTLVKPMDLTVSYSKFSDLGLDIKEDDPGVITPLHVLAEYYKQVKHVSKKDMSKYIDVSKSGFLNKIEDYKGTSNNNSYDYWMFTVNDMIPADENGLGYLMTTAPLKNGDKLTIFGIDMLKTRYYAAFTAQECSTGENIPVSVTLKTSDIYEFNKSLSSIYDISPAKVKAYKEDKDGKLVEIIEGQDFELSTSFSKYGIGKVTFYKAGTYYLSAIRLDGNNSENYISRPLIKVNVSDENSFKIDKDIDRLKISATKLFESVTINNTAKGAYYDTPIVWESEDESLLKIEPFSNDRYKFIPQNLHLTEDKTVNAKATMILGNEVREKNFEFTILKSLYLKELKVEGIDKTINPLTENSLVYTLNDTMKELTITPILEAETSDLEITINGDMVNNGEDYKYTVDSSKFSNIINIKVSRVGTNASKEYNIYLCKVASELPDYSSNWGTAKQDNNNNSTVNSFTPRNVDEINKDASWFIDLREGKPGWGKWSYPIVVNKNIYIAVDDKLQKYDLDGKLLAETQLDSTVLGAGYTGWLSYGEGMIFVPLGAGSIQAFNANDLTPLWISSKMSTYSQTSCPLLYNDGYLYTGVTNGSNRGAFGCIKVSDDDKSSGYEVKEPVWVFSDEQTDPSFYWAGATIVDNYLVVPCDTGKVYSIDLKKSIEGGKAIVVDTFQADEKVRTSICHDETTNTLYFPTGGTEGIFYSVKLDNKTGKFGESKSLRLGSQSNCAPVVYRDRVYVTSKSGIHVINKNTLEQIYLAEATDMGQDSQFIRHLSLTTAYAREDNNYEVYLYGYNYSTPGYVSLLKDTQVAEDGEVQLLHTNTESPQYSTSNVVIADDGSLLYVNDSRHLFCLKSKVTEESYNNELISLVNAKIPSEVTVDNISEVVAATKAYDKLPDGAKAQMDTTLLVEAQNKVAALIQGGQAISIEGANWYDMFVVKESDKIKFNKVEELLNEGKLEKLYDISLVNIMSNEMSTIGENGVVLRIPAVDMGKYSDLEIVQLLDDGTLNYLTPTIKDGILEVRVNSMNPVGIKLFNKKVISDDNSGNNNNNNNNVENNKDKVDSNSNNNLTNSSNKTGVKNLNTGDDNNVLILIVSLISLAVILGSIETIRRRKRIN